MELVYKKKEQIVNTATARLLIYRVVVSLVGFFGKHNYFTSIQHSFLMRIRQMPFKM